MPAQSFAINLTHHFLIAMPGLEDDTFSRSVVYLCEHTERGALGLIINKPSDLKLPSLFAKVDLPLHRKDLTNTPVFEGGPVHKERGFVLHQPQTAQPIVVADPMSELLAIDQSASAGEEQTTFYQSTLCIPGGLEMTTSKDVLEALSNGAGPRKLLVSLGYSSWAQGQLESELAENTWLHVAADAAVIFDTPVELRYSKALALLGLQEWMISPSAGHA